MNSNTTVYYNLEEIQNKYRNFTNSCSENSDCPDIAFCDFNVCKYHFYCKEGDLTRCLNKEDYFQNEKCQVNEDCLSNNCVDNSCNGNILTCRYEIGNGSGHCLLDDNSRCILDSECESGICRRSPVTFIGKCSSDDPCYDGECALSILILVVILIILNITFCCFCICSTIVRK